MENFKTLYYDMKIITQRYGTLDTFSDSPFVNFLIFQKLVEFLSYSGPVYCDLVRFFLLQPSIIWKNFV